MYETEIRKYIKGQGYDEKTVWDPEAVQDFDRFTDDLVKVLNAHLAAIPNLRFSDKLLQNAWEELGNMINEGVGAYEVMNKGKDKRFMLISDERTDRVLAMFGTLACDTERLSTILGLFREIVVGVKKELVSSETFLNCYFACEAKLEKNKHLISSSKLSNPYRALYTYKKSLV